MTTKLQRLILEEMVPGKWYNAEMLQCLVTTLQMLQRQGYVEPKSGFMEMNRTQAYYRLKRIGG